MHTVPSPARIRSFRKKVLDHYARSGRDLPWRKRVTPYRVLVSEIMLQQTRVERVIGKYPEFLAAFPDFASLAQAPTAGLLRVWAGLGYNRRALALKKIAQVVEAEYKGRLPSDPELLKELPGIGPYTAGAVAAFAFNLPGVFLDTNIRRVFIHEFFRDRHGIRDEEILPLLRRTLPRKEPRTWYNALMDYGATLAEGHENPNRRSARYRRQSPFENSNRQVRGRILKVLVREAPLSARGIIARTEIEAEWVLKNLAQMEKEGFVTKRGRSYTI